MKKLSLAGIGCGARTWKYMSLAKELLPERFEVVAAADPVAVNVERIRHLSGNENFRAFSTAQELLDCPRLADILIIGTQDDYHYEPCMQALDRGYDILLEKPIAPRLEEMLEMEEKARKLGRRVMLCHIYRYAPFYLKIKKIIASGALGEIVSVNASEGVMPWHQAHSFVRGKWAVEERSNPMILAKCCHDMDLLSWIIDRPCLSVSGFGALSHFREEKAPAGAPARCTEGCPVGDSCEYNALRYAAEQRYPWLPQIYERAEEASPEEIIDWLRVSPWGRCVYRCDNDVVDHQTLNLLFDGDITCTFTMTAFERGRHIDIYGTKGTLKGGENFKEMTGYDLVMTAHGSHERRFFYIEPHSEGYIGHEGGDEGLVRALYGEMLRETPEEMRTSITRSLESHLMALAAEEARVTGQVVTLESLRNKSLKTRSTLA